MIPDLEFKAHESSVTLTQSLINEHSIKPNLVLRSNLTLDTAILSAQQKEIDKTLDIVHPLKDKEGRIYCCFSIREFCEEIRAIVRKFDNVSIKKFEISGSFVAFALQTAPEYFHGLAQQLSKLPLESIDLLPFSFNDVDVRVFLENADKAIRAQIGREVVSFLVRKIVQNQQGLSFLAAKVYEIFLKENSIQLPNEIEQVSSCLQACVSVVKTDLDPNSFESMIELLAKKVVFNNLFEDYCNVDEKSLDRPNRMLSMSFGFVDILGIQNIRRFYLGSLDAPRLTFDPSKGSKACLSEVTPFVKQGLLDRAMNVQHLNPDSDAIDEFDFLKLMDNVCRNGSEIADPEDEQRAVEKFVAGLTNPSRPLFFGKHLHKHHRNSALNSAAYLFNVCRMLICHGYVEKLGEIFIQANKEIKGFKTTCLQAVKDSVHKRWIQSIPLLETWLQAIALIHVKRQIACNENVIILIRQDLIKSSLKLALRDGVGSRFYYLKTDYKPETLQDCLSKILESNERQEQFLELCRVVLNKEDSLMLLCDLAVICSDLPQVKELWNIIIKKALIAKQEEVFLHADKAEAWGEDDIWNLLVPSQQKARICSLFKLENDELAQKRYRQFAEMYPDEALDLFQAIIPILSERPAIAEALLTNLPVILQSKGALEILRISKVKLISLIKKAIEDLSLIADISELICDFPHVLRHLEEEIPQIFKLLEEQSREDLLTRLISVMAHPEQAKEHLKSPEKIIEHLFERKSYTIALVLLKIMPAEVREDKLMKWAPILVKEQAWTDCQFLLENFDSSPVCQEIAKKLLDYYLKGKKLGEVLSIFCLMPVLPVFVWRNLMQELSKLENKALLEQAWKQWLKVASHSSWQMDQESLRLGWLYALKMINKGNNTKLILCAIDQLDSLMELLKESNPKEALFLLFKLLLNNDSAAVKKTDVLEKIARLRTMAQSYPSAEWKDLDVKWVGVRLIENYEEGLKDLKQSLGQEKPQPEMIKLLIKACQQFPKITNEMAEKVFPLLRNIVQTHVSTLKPDERLSLFKTCSTSSRFVDHRLALAFLENTKGLANNTFMALLSKILKEENELDCVDLERMSILIPQQKDFSAEVKGKAIKWFQKRMSSLPFDKMLLLLRAFPLIALQKEIQRLYLDRLIELIPNQLVMFNQQLKEFMKVIISATSRQLNLDPHTLRGSYQQVHEITTSPINPLNFAEHPALNLYNSNIKPDLASFAKTTLDKLLIYYESHADLPVSIQAFLLDQALSQWQTIFAIRIPREWCAELCRLMERNVYVCRYSELFHDSASDWKIDLQSRLFDFHKEQMLDVMSSCCQSGIFSPKNKQTAITGAQLYFHFGKVITNLDIPPVERAHLFKQMLMKLMKGKTSDKIYANHLLSRIDPLTVYKDLSFVLECVEIVKPIVVSHYNSVNGINLVFNDFSIFNRILIKHCIDFHQVDFFKKNRDQVIDLRKLCITLVDINAAIAKDWDQKHLQPNSINELYIEDLGKEGEQNKKASFFLLIFSTLLNCFSFDGYSEDYTECLKKLIPIISNRCHYYPFYTLFEPMYKLFLELIVLKPFFEDKNNFSKTPEWQKRRDQFIEAVMQHLINEKQLFFVCKFHEDIQQLKFYNGPTLQQLMPNIDVAKVTLQAQTYYHKKKHEVEKGIAQNNNK